MERLKSIFEKYLLEQIPDKEPASLYTAMRYVLQNGGKRIRPLLVLLSAKSFGSPVEKALPAASSIEIFHNFTLIHDDIMDHSDVRRGKATVHEKWDENLAILSGDTMLVWAYKMLENYNPEIFKKLNVLLNQTAIEICEGQQMDMDFEHRNDVPMEEYLRMIRLKTAVLLGTALQFGGIVAGAADKNLEAFKDYGEKIGLAFQIQDDYLDTFGDHQKFGKKIGRDIIDRKKTFLYITALQKAREEDRKKLIDLYQNTDIDETRLVPMVIEIFKKYRVDQISLKKIQDFTEQALSALDQTGFSPQEKDFWKQFAYDLMNREK